MLIKDIKEIQGIVQQDLEKLGLYLCDYCECPNQEFDHHILHLQGKCGDCATTNMYRIKRAYDAAQERLTERMVEGLEGLFQLFGQPTRTGSREDREAQYQKEIEDYIQKHNEEAQA